MTPPPTPPHLRADRLWRSLADAQDAALARGTPPALRTPRLRRSRVRARRLGAALLMAGAAVTALVLFAVRAPRPLRGVGGGFAGGVASVSGGRDEAGRTLVADARSDLPLQFSNGSSLTFRAGSTGRMQRLGDDGAQVFLEEGRLEAHVVHTRTTLWMVHAGPYRVRVTGTRFEVNWAAARLDVSLFEGSVVIDGAELGAGVPLRAGQRLTVDRGVVRTELLPPGAPDGTRDLTGASASASEELGDRAGARAKSPAPSEAMGASEAVVDREAPAGSDAPAGSGASARVSGGDAPSGAPAKGRAVAVAIDENEWLMLAKQSAYAEAFSSAMRVGWRTLCHRLDAHRLLTLGDVARYAGSRPRAQQAFESLVARFPRDPLAADAVFSLGRLAFESDQSDRAARWFRRYVADWPQGPLVDQAVGRLVECAIHMHDGEAARDAARAYLLRAPTGPHARLARQVLRDGAGVTASAAPGLSPRGSPGVPR